MLAEPHSIAPVVGLVGDCMTFAGGIILAIDAAQQESRFKKIREMVDTYLSPELLRLKIEVGGVKVTNEKDIELPFIRHSAKLARLGSVLLALGFAALLGYTCVGDN